MPSRSPTFLLLEVFTVFSQDRFQLRFLELIMVMMLIDMELCTVHAEVEELSWDRVQQLVVWMRPWRTPPSGCSSVTPPRASLITGTDAPARPPGSHLQASGSSGSARRAQEGRSGTGTRILVSVHVNSRGEGLGIPSPHLGCHLWQTCSVSTCCLRRTVGFFWVWIRFLTVRFSVST